jgi:uncharacterized protein (TIGR02231 family)
MKKVLMSLLLFPIGISAQKVNEIQVKSEVKQVKLFLTAGELSHKVETKWTKGRNKLIFTGISAYADPQSIRFSSSQNYRLVSFSTEMDFLAAEEGNTTIGKLKDSLSEMKDRLQLNADIQNSYQAEIAVLNTNRDLKGQNQNISVAQIKEAADFYRTRTLDINKQISKLNKEKAELANKIELLRFQLTELNYNENQRSNQVIVLIDVDQAQTSTCELSYLVSDCGWAASYDLSTTDLNQKINLKYKAKIYNNTGNDWNNIDLILSTADPRLSASQPTMNPWYLDYYSGASKTKSSSYYAPQNYKQDYRAEAENNLQQANQRAYDNYMLDKEEVLFENSGRLDVKQTEQKKKQKDLVVFKQIEVSELNAEFVIPAKFSCPSDGKPYSVDVKEMNLDASFSYVSVPKLDNGAFLIANIVGWQDLDLIPGPTNVYFGGMFVGVSQIDTRSVSDTLALSFGRDAKVTVLRKLKQEVSSKKVVGSSKRETYLYEIAIKNNRSVPVKVDVFDQIPIARNTEITVTADEVSGGKRDLETGEVSWEIMLQPGEVKTVQIGYTVKYPKNATVTLQRYRTISAPSF